MFLGYTMFVYIYFVYKHIYMWNFKGSVNIWILKLIYVKIWFHMKFKLLWKCYVHTNSFGTA
jgi:hypothetical protein